jgi:hypothetical protein
MFIIDFVQEVIGYTTARILLPIISFGNVRVQKLTSDETGFNWAGFKREPNGGFVCQTPMAGWIGLVPWAFLLIAIFAAA